ncbi:MAG: PH domain-containing protein [Solirubrobacterales bacterium]
MQKFLPEKGYGAWYIAIATIIIDAVLSVVLKFSNSYEIALVLQVFFVVFNLYQLYYLFMYLSINYVVENEELKIISLFGMKKVSIPFSEIKCYKTFSGKIKGIKLSGYGADNFNIGRSVIEKTGTTYMYVTNSKNIVYINTNGMNYGLSPKDIDKFLQCLGINEVCETNYEYRTVKHINLFKDKRFAVPFAICTILIGIITIYPILRYLNHTIPAVMPMSFDSKFQPISFGTGKQFAFKQMTLGLLNLAILFCMYYASVFIARYDKKAVYKYIYVALILSVIFIIVQGKIFLTFR